MVPGITDQNTLACIARARTYRYHCQLVDQALSGKCPFCELDQGRNRVITDNSSWTAIHCNPPEAHTRIHVLFIPNRHVTDSNELSDQEWLDLKHIRITVQQTLGYESRGLLMRDGDARMSAGTIAHLHIHEMVPDRSGRVESPFYKGDESEIEGLRRAIIFEKLHRAGVRPDEASNRAQEILSREEQELVAGRLK